MSEKIIYSVKQINSYIKDVLEKDFILRNICVKGEISNCKYHGSGHIYFSLKDENSIISCVMFAGNAARLRIKLEDGLEVLVYGRIGVFEKSGRYQLYASSVENSGKGDLYRQFEELKAKLLEMGMFSPEYKKPIPEFSYKIGVVTAKTGAVIHDIYVTASNLNPYAQIILYPAIVQGSGAPASIISGIKALDKLNLDVIIVGRGGGSIEDLWGFNDEGVARAIFDCETSVISAVGHETDTTIADLVADFRAATPTAAAKAAVFDYNAFLMSLAEIENSLKTEMDRNVCRNIQLLDQYKDTLKLLSPESRIAQKKKDLLFISDSLKNQIRLKLQNARYKLFVYSEKLEGMSPLKRLSEGYSFVTDSEGKALKSIAQVSLGDELEINILDGLVTAEVKDIKDKDYERK